MPFTFGLVEYVCEQPTICRRFGLKWQYLPDESAVLLDKIYKFDGITTYELGGQAAELVLHDKGADAVHTTCYEQKSKVMGLKVCFCVLMCSLLLCEVVRDNLEHVEVSSASF